MFKNMKLSAKLISSFVIVAAITLVVGFVGWRGVNNLSHHLEEVGEVRLPSIAALLVIEREAEAIRVAQRTLLNPDLTREDHARQFANIKHAREHYEAAWQKYEPLPQTPEEAALWKKFVSAWDAWRQENNAFFKLIHDLEKLDIGNPAALNATLEMVRGDHYKLMVDTEALIAGGNSFDGGEDHNACRFGEWAAAFKSQNATISGAIAQMAEPHKQFHAAVAAIKTAVQNGDREKAHAILTDTMQPAAKGVFAGLEVMRDEAAKAVTLFENAGQYAMVTARDKQVVAMDLLEQIVKLNEDVAHASEEAASIETRNAKIMAVAGMAAGFLAALAFGIFLSTSINRALTRITDGLGEGAEQVASASEQVSSSSQSLAEGASEQAASIEETSSSLEEMAAMTNQNADNAKQANGLMSEANQVVDQANASMEELIRSMGEISQASEETSKIIKTIDEIAFQTNLLALNAAVEAARAGEAGAGFAVVADEVRNLAMRAADAAKNTAALIEGTVKKVGDGSEIVTRTNEAFTQVASSSRKVGDLVGEIAAASGEQAQGIDQVNKAASEMGQVTQQAAANAEESASASEELSAQAEQMQAMVKELMAMVGGHRQSTATAKAPKARAKVSSKKTSHGKNKTSNAAEQVIPFDDEEAFSNF